MFNLITKYSTVYLRLALGAAFLSAVADRFGLWGSPGESLVAWGSFDNFLAYTATLNPYVPSFLIPAVGWSVTFAEIALGVALILGFRIRETAALSGAMLLSFAIGMSVGVGVKAPVDYSVFTASAAAFLLAVQSKSPLSIDALRGQRERKDYGRLANSRLSRI